MDHTHGRGRPLDRPLTPADLGFAPTPSAYGGPGPRYRRYPKGMWFLALLGVPGGVLGYVMLRDTNAGAARSILMTGFFVQALIFAAWVAQVAAQSASAMAPFDALFTVLR